MKTITRNVLLAMMMLAFPGLLHKKVVIHQILIQSKPQN
jgi:hypothetical protein